MSPFRLGAVQPQPTLISRPVWTARPQLLASTHRHGHAARRALTPPHRRRIRGPCSHPLNDSGIAVGTLDGEGPGTVVPDPVRWRTYRKRTLTGAPLPSGASARRPPNNSPNAGRAVRAPRGRTAPSPFKNGSPRSDHSAERARAAAVGPRPIRRGAEAVWPAPSRSRSPPAHPGGPPRHTCSSTSG
jgi:hypothetical protein